MKDRALIALLLVFATGAWAEKKNCPCVADTYVQLSEGVPWTADQAGKACEGLYPGSNRNIITDGDKIHNPGGDIRNALMKFDLSGLSGQITNATLRLRCSLERYTNMLGTLSVHPMLVEWNEMEADWLKRTTTESWIGGAIESNGNYEAEASATKINPPTENWRHTFVEFDVTGLVNRWVNGGLENHGVILMSASDSGRGKRMDWCSRDGNPWRSNQWPWLVIDFVPATASPRPAPPAASDPAVSEPTVSEPTGIPLL